MNSQIQFFCPRWGSERLGWEDFLRTAKDAGYDGIEFGVSKETTQPELEQIFTLAGKQNMLLILQQYDTYDGDFASHKQAFATWFDKIKSFQPLFVNSQTGKDFFSMQQNKVLFEIADNYSIKTGIAVNHETHRNKCLFAAHIAKQYFTALPELTITLDMSHWVCVAESLLGDQSEAMQLACSRTQHIHARIGYAEGPQVTNPFLPQWEKELAAHLYWWDVIVNRKRSEKQAITITPEFGAYPYMVHLPTGEPVANQWEINAGMMNLLKKRYSAGL